jgi:Holliday junction resolvasome RuvABC endonuclease subunit
MANLLALDQASQTTGYAIFKDGKLFTYGKFSFDDDIAERLVKIRKKVLSLIEEYQIEEVAFEDIQMQNNVMNNVQTFKVLSEVFGVILETLKEINIQYTIVSSNT